MTPPDPAPVADRTPLAQRPVVLIAEHLGKRYRTGSQEIVALDDVNLRVQAGEFIVLLGPSGSGKSTLLNILGGLDRPSNGRAWFAEHDLSDADDAALTRYRREHVGFVFQFYNLMPSLTVRENVQLVTDLMPHAMAAEDALALVGLSARLDHFPAQLSGGEQQRVAIARAFVNRPMLLIADEPTGNLDPNTSVGIMKLLDRINRTGTTVIMATHDAAIVDQMRKRVIELEGGKLVSIIDVEQVQEVPVALMIELATEIERLPG